MDRALVPGTFRLSSFSPSFFLSFPHAISFAIRGYVGARSTFLIPRSFPLFLAPSRLSFPFLPPHAFPSRTRSRGIPRERDVPDYLSPAFGRASCLRPPTRRPDALSYHSIRFSHCHERAWVLPRMGDVHSRIVSLIDGYEHSSRRVCEKTLNESTCNKHSGSPDVSACVWEDVGRDKQWGIKSMRWNEGSSREREEFFFEKLYAPGYLATHRHPFFTSQNKIAHRSAAAYPFVLPHVERVMDYPEALSSVWEWSSRRRALNFFHLSLRRLLKRRRRA